MLDSWPMWHNTSPQRRVIPYEEILSELKKFISKY